MIECEEGELALDLKEIEFLFMSFENVILQFMLREL